MALPELPKADPIAIPSDLPDSFILSCRTHRRTWHATTIASICKSAEYKAWLRYPNDPGLAAMSDEQRRDSWLELAYLISDTLPADIRYDESVAPLFGHGLDTEMTDFRSALLCLKDFINAAAELPFSTDQPIEADSLRRSTGRYLPPHKPARTEETEEATINRSTTPVSHSVRRGFPLVAWPYSDWTFSDFITVMTSGRAGGLGCPGCGGSCATLDPSGKVTTCQDQWYDVDRTLPLDQRRRSPFRRTDFAHGHGHGSKRRKVLVVMLLDHHEAKVCFKHTVYNNCDGLNCPFLHVCTLCLKEDHPGIVCPKFRRSKLDEIEAILKSTSTVRTTSLTQVDSPALPATVGLSIQVRTSNGTDEITRMLQMQRQQQEAMERERAAVTFISGFTALQATENVDDVFGGGDLTLSPPAAGPPPAPAEDAIEREGAAITTRKSPPAGVAPSAGPGATATRSASARRVFGPAPAVETLDDDVVLDEFGLPPHPLGELVELTKQAWLTEPSFNFPHGNHGLIPSGIRNVPDRWPSIIPIPSLRDVEAVYPMTHPGGLARPDANLALPHAPYCPNPPGLVLSLRKEHFDAVAPPAIHSNLAHLFATAHLTPTVEDYAMKSFEDSMRSTKDNQTADGVLKQKINNPHQGTSHGSVRMPYQPAHFETYVNGKVIKFDDLKARYQRLDGSWSLANLHLMLHYPVPHGDSHVLSTEAYATNALIRAGIQQTDANCWQNSAVYNLINHSLPASGSDTLKCVKLSTEIDAMPIPYTWSTAMIDLKCQLNKTFLDSGRAIFTTAHGAEARGRFQDTLLDLLGDRYEAFAFSISVPRWEDWECDVFGKGESTVLRQNAHDRFLADDGPFPANVSPFINHAEFRQLWDDSYDVTRRPQVDIPFTFIRPKAATTGGTLFGWAPHPQVANSPGKDLRESCQVLDLLVDFYKNLQGGSLYRGEIPPSPSFYFSKHVDLVSIAKASGQTTPRKGLKLTRDGPDPKTSQIMLKRLRAVAADIRISSDNGFYFSAASLPPNLRKAARRGIMTTVTRPSIKSEIGVKLDAVRKASFVIGSDSGVKGGKKGKRTEAQRAVSSLLGQSRRELLADEGKLKADYLRAGEEPWESITGCGKLCEAGWLRVDKVTRAPVVVQQKLGSAAHPFECEMGTKDDVGIPLNKEQRDKILRSAGGRDLERPGRDVAKRWETAVKAYQEAQDRG